MSSYPPILRYGGGRIFEHIKHDNNYLIEQIILNNNIYNNVSRLIFHMFIFYVFGSLAHFQTKLRLLTKGIFLSLSGECEVMGPIHVPVSF